MPATCKHAEAPFNGVQGAIWEGSDTRRPVECCTKWDGPPGQDARLHAYVLGQEGTLLFCCLALSNTLVFLQLQETRCTGHIHTGCPMWLCLECAGFTIVMYCSRFFGSKYVALGFTSISRCVKCFTMHFASCVKGCKQAKHHAVMWILSCWYCCIRCNLTAQLHDADLWVDTYARRRLGHLH